MGHFRDRILQMDPGWKALYSRKAALTTQAVLAGASAGPVTGVKNAAGVNITPNDRLVSVTYFTKSTNLTAVTDLSGEFKITAVGSIDNTGGTASTGGYLQIVWESWDS